MHKNLISKIVTIAPGKVYIPKVLNEGKKLTDKELIHLEKKRQEAYDKGDLSKASRRNLINSLDWLVYRTATSSVIGRKRLQTAKRNLGLITLTLPQEMNTNCKFVKDIMFNTFLTSLRQREKKLSYVWKAERQKNGRLHFHLVVNKFFDWEWLNNLWFGICLKNNYAMEWTTGERKIKPKCVDVAGVRKVEKIRAYLIKYMSKGSDLQPIDGRLWGSSYDISRLSKVMLEVSPEFIEEIIEGAKAGRFFKIECEYGDCYMYDYLKTPDTTVLNLEYLLDCSKELNCGELINKTGDSRLITLL
jgi:hypothetical protein